MLEGLFCQRSPNNRSAVKDVTKGMKNRYDHNPTW
jgi:hypothetical protein